MRTMLLDAYGGKRRFYLYDYLDPQKLHYLARNFEIAFGNSGHARDDNGQLFLCSATRSMVKVTQLRTTRRQADRVAGPYGPGRRRCSSRQIKNVIQGVASAVFFPI